jgi:hypothetical protein
MTGRTSEELDRIGTAQELEVAPLRAGGVDKDVVAVAVDDEGAA